MDTTGELEYEVRGDGDPILGPNTFRATKVGYQELIQAVNVCGGGLTNVPPLLITAAP